MHRVSTFPSLALAGFGLAIASAPAGATWSVGECLSHPVAAEPRVEPRAISTNFSEEDLK